MKSFWLKHHEEIEGWLLLIAGTGIITVILLNSERIADAGSQALFGISWKELSAPPVRETLTLDCKRINVGRSGVSHASDLCTMPDGQMCIFSDKRTPDFCYASSGVNR